MKSDGPAADVIVVGGGFSGTMVAAELARRGVSSVLIDGSGREGKGTAYSTPEDAHLLNVVAGRMGAWADRPGDFAETIAAEGYAADAYVPRRRYGEYLAAILNEARVDGLVMVVASDAQAAERTEHVWTVELADGSRVAVLALVLAQGNQAPEPPSLARNMPAELFVNDPWSDAGRAAVARAAASGGDVLIIGTGLTMVDVVLSLDEAQHRARIVAVSRRGLVPRAHAEFEPAPVALDEVP
ncbi:MAG TPA: FAD/NAD(P)-binding protein, partial [Sphingomicrobium sp.]